MTPQTKPQALGIHGREAAEAPSLLKTKKLRGLPEQWLIA
jgi:hypothetical protein